MCYTIDFSVKYYSLVRRAEHSVRFGIKPTEKNHLQKYLNATKTNIYNHKETTVGSVFQHPLEATALADKD